MADAALWIMVVVLAVVIFVLMKLLKRILVAATSIPRRVLTGVIQTVAGNRVPSMRIALSSPPSPAGPAVRSPPARRARRAWTTAARCGSSRSAG